MKLNPIVRLAALLLLAAQTQPLVSTLWCAPGVRPPAACEEMADEHPAGIVPSGAAMAPAPATGAMDCAAMGVCAARAPLLAMPAAGSRIRLMTLAGAAAERFATPPSPDFAPTPPPPQV